MHNRALDRQASPARAVCAPHPPAAAAAGREAEHARQAGMRCLRACTALAARWAPSCSASSQAQQAARHWPAQQQQVQLQLAWRPWPTQQLFSASWAPPVRNMSWQASASIANPTLPPALAELMAAARRNGVQRPPPPPLEPRPLRFDSRRAGVIAIKAGMMQDWDEFGARVPLTVLWVDECTVVRSKHASRDGVTSLVLGAGAKRPKQLHPRQAGEFRAHGLPPKRKLWECRVSDDALLPPGTLLGASHFVAGQYLDVTGVTKGKGFAGVMKRWNFAGQGASHGNTKHHRAPGAIGGRTDPGRVWKGKKMPGHLGCERVTFKNIWLYKVDPSRNLLYVRGQVPGPQGSWVFLRDAFRWKWADRAAAQLPFPTFLGEELPPTVVAPRDGLDPYRVYREDVGYFEADWKGD